MTLKDISYSGIVKLALVFIIVPRLASRLYEIITRPLRVQIRENMVQIGKNVQVTTEETVQQNDLFLNLLIKDLVFFITLFISTFILTKIIEYLAKNTKLGNMNLGKHRR